LTTNDREKTATNTGFCASGADGINSNFVLLSPAVLAEVILSANEQIINFFILYSADVRADGTLNSPPAQSPVRCTPL